MSTREKLQKLNSAKVELEAKIAHNGDILSANGDVGMNGPLVDADGFPRNDIDIYQVRQARQQIICLQNDYKELLNQIHNLLNQYHSETANAANSTKEDGSGELYTAEEIHKPTEATRLELRPIVTVNLVSPSSPAEDAGLRVGDLILEFGTINSGNFNNDLNQIGTVVRHMQNQRINLKVKRNERILDLILIPKAWSGRGLLGCNIVLPTAS